MTLAAIHTTPGPGPTPAAPTPDQVKAKQQAAWSSGDYAVVGTTLQIVGEQLCESIDLRPGCTVLDVAAGNGNATLAAGRRFCDVTSTDYVESLLEKGRARARAERLPVRFQVADVEALPFEAGRFDAVLSTFGAMFAPDQERTASEMIRVCRPGGVIGMANWTPDSMIGHVFRALGAHLPPPPGIKSPALWGVEEHVRTLFGPAAESVVLVPRTFMFRYRSTDHFMDIFRRFYGPIHKAFQALDEAAGAALDRDLRAVLARFNRAADGTLRAPSDYVEVIVRKAAEPQTN